MPRRSPLHHNLAPVLAGVAVFGLDQLSKALAVRYLTPHGAEGVHLAGGVVYLRYLENSGAAFGLLQGQSLFLIVTTTLLVGLLLGAYRLLFERRPWLRLMLGALLGGALGNLADRVRLGYVVDFIDVTYWPVFNLADSVISAGAVILALSLLLPGRRQHPAGREA